MLTVYLKTTVTSITITVFLLIILVCLGVVVSVGDPNLFEI